MTLENANGIHSKEKSQVSDRSKTTADQYSEFKKIDNDAYVGSKTVEEIDHKKVRILPDISFGESVQEA